MQKCFMTRQRSAMQTVHPANTRNERSAMYTVFKNNLYSRKTVITKKMFTTWQSLVKKVKEIGMILYIKLIEPTIQNFQM